jgi:hypothetical protein
MTVAVHFSSHRHEDVNSPSPEARCKRTNLSTAIHSRDKFRLETHRHIHDVRPLSSPSSIPKEPLVNGTQVASFPAIEKLKFAGAKPLPTMDVDTTTTTATLPPQHQPLPSATRRRPRHRKKKMPHLLLELHRSLDSFTIVL